MVGMIDGGSDFPRGGVAGAAGDAPHFAAAAKMILSAGLEALEEVGLE